MKTVPTTGTVWALTRGTAGIGPEWKTLLTTLAWPDVRVVRIISGAQERHRVYKVASDPLRASLLHSGYYEREAMRIPHSNNTVQTFR